MKTENKKLTKSLSFFLSVFLIVLTAYTTVAIQNKIKEREYIGQETEARNNITVSGTGKIYTKPNLALISFSVITEKESIGKAMEENTEKMNNIISEIKEEGIEEKDLKTTGYNIYPRYEWYEKTEEKPQGERVLVGYEVYQTLEVKIRDLGKIGNIIQKATEKGANKVSNLQFTVENEDEIKKQAREEAIKKAKDKAEEIASQLGVNLVKIINFEEGQIVSPRYYSLEKAAGVSEDLSIEAGENKIEVTVNITYKLD